MDEKQLKESVASLLKDGNKEALAQMIVEYVEPQHITLDFVGMLLNSRSLNPGDSLVKKIRKGLKVHSLVPGAIPLAGEITVTDRINYVLDGAIITANANLWELENGEIGTVESIRNEMTAKFRDYYMNKVFTALSTIWTVGNTPDNYVTVATALNSTVLKHAIDTINQTTGGVKAVVGTRAALTPITTFGAGWADGYTTPVSHGVTENISQIMNTGWLGRYYGAPLVAITQQYDNPEDYNALIPENKVLVIGENVGEFITYGDVKTQQYTDMRPVPPQWILSLYQQFGLIIDKAAGIYVIEIT